MLQCQSWDRVGTRQQILQWHRIPESVCAAQGIDAPHIDQNSLEAPVHNKLAWDTQMVSGDWVAVGDLCCLCWSVHSLLGLAFLKGQKKWFQMGIIAHIFSITGLLEVLLATFFPPNSKFFLSQGKHTEKGVIYLSHSRNIQPYHHVKCLELNYK